MNQGEEILRLRESVHRLNEEVGRHALESLTARNELGRRIDALSYVLEALGDPRRVNERLQRIEDAANDAAAAAARSSSRRQGKLSGWQLVFAGLGTAVVLTNFVIGLVHLAGG